MRRLLIAAALLVGTASNAAAQFAWDAPPLVSQVAPSGLSLFLIGPAGADLGGLATYRHAAGPVGLGYRIGVADGPGDGLSVAGGVDVSGFLSRSIEGEAAFDVLWWSGAGVGVGDDFLLSIPLGLLIGWSGGDGDAVLSPYAGGHLALDIFSGDNDDVDLSGSFDLGLDLQLASGLMIRFGGSIGDRDAVAIGVRLTS